MTAGPRISHSEVSTPRRRALHGVQLWVALPDAPRHSRRPSSTPSTVPVDDGARRCGCSSARWLGQHSRRVDVSHAAARRGADLPPGSAVELPFDPAFEHGVLVDPGDVAVDGGRSRARPIWPTWPARHRLAAIGAGEPAARVVLLGGEPLDEEIVMWWNFIGRSHDEIVEFRRQWQADVIAGADPPTAASAGRGLRRRSAAGARAADRALEATEVSAPVVESSSPDAIARRARGRVAARWLAVVLPTVLALVLGLQRSMAVPFWRDEYATAAFARLPLGDLLQALGQVDAVLGPYYLLAHLASPVLGLETGLRVLSLGAFTASAAVVAVIALRWWGPLAASAAGLAFATNVLAITYGAMARPYALAVLFVALAVLAADAAAAAGRRWAWVAYAAAASAASRDARAGPRRGPAHGAPRGGAHTGTRTQADPMVVRDDRGAGRRRRHPTREGPRAAPAGFDWMSEPTVRTAIADLARAAGVSIDREVAFDAVALLVLAAMSAAAIAAAARTPSFQNIEPPAPIRASAVARARPVAFAAALAFVPWALLLGASWLVTPILATRYIAWSSIGTALAVAAAVRATQTASKRLAIIAGVLAAIVLAVSIGFAATRPLERPAPRRRLPRGRGTDPERGGAG